MLDAYTVHAAHLVARALAGEPESERPLLEAATSWDERLREGVAHAALAVVLDSPTAGIDGDALADLARPIGNRISWLRRQRAAVEGKPEAMGHPPVDPVRLSAKVRAQLGPCAVEDPGPDDLAIPDAVLIERAAAGAEGAELALLRRAASADPEKGLLAALAGFVVCYDARPLDAASLVAASDFVAAKMARTEASLWRAGRAVA